MRNGWVVVAAVVAVVGARRAHADFVVENGRFTTVYVYPDSDKQSWDDYVKQKRPSDWQQFTRKAIDDATEKLMSPQWPSFFGGLHQYGGINAPRWFGSHVVSTKCFAAMKKDLLHDHKVLEIGTARTLANCHEDGMDPSPQIILVLAPDIGIGDPMKMTNDGPDECAKTTRHTVAYHSGGLNVPDFAVLPTEPGCAASFDRLTDNLSHEVAELLSDPKAAAHGGGFVGTELGDQCEDQDTQWNGLNLQRYRSDNDKMCWPAPIANVKTSAMTTWVLGEGSPKIRFTGSVHELKLDVPAKRTVTSANAKQIQIWIQTGGDDLRGGNDNADVTLRFAGGTTVTKNINAGHEWGNGQTHMAQLTLPASGVKVSDIQGITLTTHFGGGMGGDNWNVDKVALIVEFPAGSGVSEPTQPVVHDWLDASGGPLVRFTGSKHDIEEKVDPHDAGTAIGALELVISTGNDDLRGGSKAGDNCDVTIELANGTRIALTNVNKGATWNGWTDHSVTIPLPSRGLKGGDVTSVKLHTGFGGGIGGDNWNVQRIRLRATLK